MILISKMKDMKRVFSYHGAEHKTIRCYEAKLPLTVENARSMTRLHPRCGTSFLFVVIIISILVFARVQRHAARSSDHAWPDGPRGWLTAAVRWWRSAMSSTASSAGMTTG